MKTQNHKSNSERKIREKATKGWDPAFFLLSEETIKNKIFLVRLRKEVRR